MKILLENIVNGFLFSTDKEKLNVPYIHAFLSQRSYWAKGIPLNTVRRSIENSLSVGIYDRDKQIGFARVITDYATFAYLADVFVDEAYRGNGISKNLMSFVLSVGELKNLRRILLGTRDAHGLYARYGFKALHAPDRFMEVHHPNVYAIEK